MDILYTCESKGTMDQVCGRLQQAVKAHRFGVLGVVDLQGKMREKGVPFEKACRVIEVCNPHQAKQVLDQQMAIATALPCRIAVWEEAGAVKLATILPTETLKMFGVPGLEVVAREVEQAIKAMMDEAVMK